MKENNSICISFSISGYDDPANPHPRDIEIPETVVNNEWISQTLGECIWKLFEFENELSRKDFLDNLPEVYKKDFVTITTPKQAFYDHWVDGILSSPENWHIKEYLTK